jgi:DNA-binding winged helix-turn-helix (wHTH) protein
VQPPASQASQIITIGDYELDVDAGELRRLGRPIRLQPQPFKLLTLLVSRAGQVVTRDDIRKELWAEDTFVDFDQGANYCIRQIREALRDDAERPVFVATVPKRGYRFIAPVHRHGPAEAPRPTGVDTKLMRAVWTNIADIRKQEQRRTRLTIIVSVAAGVVALAVILFLVLR